jgi:hypothetical protein
MYYYGDTDMILGMFQKIIDFHFSFFTDMVGTDHGIVYICNKRFKTPADRIFSRVQCYRGVVSAVQRNPSFLKFFLSVGERKSISSHSLTCFIIFYFSFPIQVIGRQRYGVRS